MIPIRRARESWDAARNRDSGFIINTERREWEAWDGITISRKTVWIACHSIISKAGFRYEVGRPVVDYVNAGVLIMAIERLV